MANQRAREVPAGDFGNRAGVHVSNVGVGVGTETPEAAVHVQEAEGVMHVESTGTNSKVVVKLENDAREWQIRCTTADAFTIVDLTGGVSVVTIAAGAPAGSLAIDANGDVSFGFFATHPLQATTLGAAATTFAATSPNIRVTGHGGANTLATITGLPGPGPLTLFFVDGLVTLTDDNTHAADSFDLSAAFTSAADTVLSLVYDGTSYYEVSRSTN